MEQLENVKRHFSSEQKFNIIKENITTGMCTSETIKKYGLAASLFYKWKEAFFVGAKNGFDAHNGKITKAEQRQIAALEKENQQMKEVIAEIVNENISLKKTLGK